MTVGSLNPRWSLSLYRDRGRGRRLEAWVPAGVYPVAPYGTGMAARSVDPRLREDDAICNLAALSLRTWVPAFAGMAARSVDPRLREDDPALAGSFCDRWVIIKPMTPAFATFFSG